MPSANSQPFRYRTLDAWRGVACLLVVLDHSVQDFLGGVASAADRPIVWVLKVIHLGSIGVPMFFVISGYCIAATACSAHDQHTPLRTYMWRRFRRIYPPYWAMLGALLALFMLVDVVLAPGFLSSHGELRPWWFSPGQWLGNLTLTETWRWHVAGGPLGHIIGQSWTLCYEEQFYFVVGLLLLFPRRMFFGLLVGVTAGVVLVQQLAAANHVNLLGFFFDGYWLAFAFGISVFYATNYLERSGQTATGLGLAFTIPIVLALPGLDNARLGFSLGVSIALAAGFAVLLLVLRQCDGAVTRQRWLAPLFACGKMSYSLYLIHAIVVSIVVRLCYGIGAVSAWATLLFTVPACVFFSLLAGWLFYSVIERRFLNPSSGVMRDKNLGAAPAPALA